MSISVDRMTCLFVFTRKIVFFADLNVNCDSSLPEDPLFQGLNHLNNNLLKCTFQSVCIIFIYITFPENSLNQGHLSTNNPVNLLQKMA